MSIHTEATLQHARDEVLAAAGGPASTFLKDIEAARNLGEFKTGAKGNRRLSAEEIEALKANGNYASDWSKVLVLPGRKLLTDRIRNCVFDGNIALGSFSGQITLHGVSLSTGVYNSTLAEVVIEDNCLVKDNTLIAKTVIMTGSAVVGCGTITSTGATAFSNGIELPVGVEIGGRDIKVWAEMTFEAAAAVGAYRQDKEALRAYSAAVDKYTAKATSKFNVISQSARVINAPLLRDIYLGPAGSILQSEVQRTCVISSKEEPSSIASGSTVRDALLQWATHVDSQSIVQRGFLCEHSHVERHGKLFDSLLGPNSGIAEGECTSSFVGPFVGFHHQSLLIASFWPKGKGNVGYGANVGSNHTLKAPDQELWPGEGVFFGLSTAIKYPSNFTKAPYSVIATGCVTLAQSCEMPFSLINTPGESIPGLSPAFNEISPGWVLSDCAFTLLRNEDKYANRNKSQRTKIAWEIFRPEIVDMMLSARKRLIEAEGKAKIHNARKEAVYTDKEVPGLGKNYMRESARKSAIDAYTFYIRHYGLKGLLRQVQAGASLNTILLKGSKSCVGDQKRWSHEQEALLSEYPGYTAEQLLEEAVKSHAELAKSAARGKSRDDVRGKQIIPDYDHTHTAASKEKVVIAANKLAAELDVATKKLLSKL